MAVELKVIKNLSQLPQSIVSNGVQIVIQPKEEKIVSADIAVKFLADHKPYVVEIKTEDFAQPSQTDDLNTDVWVANMTGNPDAPANIQIKTYLNKQWVMKEIPNPKADAFDISRELAMGMKSYMHSDGSNLALNLGKTKITLPMYQRKRFAGEIGRWFIMRDRQQDMPMKGCAIHSRPPSNFEPNMSWPLNDMRVYLQLTDPQAILGLSQEEVAAEAKANGIEYTQLENKAKMLCMKRLHFRLVDPKYKLPTQSEFDAVKRSFAESNVTTPDMGEITKKIDAVLKNQSKQKPVNTR